MITLNTYKVLLALVLLLFTTSLYIEYFSTDLSFLGYRLQKGNLECLKSDLLEVDFRRRLAAKIAQVQLDIARHAGSKGGAVDSKWALQLSEVVAELDPGRRGFSGPTSLKNYPSTHALDKVASSNSTTGSKGGAVDSKWALQLREVVSELDPGRRGFSGPTSLKNDLSTHVLDKVAASNSTTDGTPRNVCPEIYKFDKENNNFPYFQKGMDKEKCTHVRKFKEILTVLIIHQSSVPEDLYFIAKIIAKYYDIRIVVLLKKGAIFNSTVPERLISLEMKYSESDSEAISRAVEIITTPFVFIGNSLSQFNNQSSLERLVLVLDTLPLVKVAAGAARDSHGRWIHGCLQQKMENYHATFDLGYYSSKYECMYCDDLLTPFVTHTKLFDQVPLGKGLNGSIVFHDWFVRVRHAGHSALTCPDVMFFVHTHPLMTDSDWKKFAQKWSLTRIKPYNQSVLEFSCSEVNISCKAIGSLVKSFLIPPCCLKLILREIGYILDFADQNSIHYELQAGSVLGAVKMGTHLPWDLDMDIIFACDDWEKWMKIKDTYLKKINCKMLIHEQGHYFVINCPTLFYEFICWRYSNHSLSRVLLPEEFIDIPTKIHFGGRWTSVISNPGLYSRNRYGIEDLQHAPHWRHLKLGNAEGHYDSAGAWNKCPDPNHHACLDRFPADGSLQFVNR
ncbi:unnamed protein product [Meganyctiphanes norvegica]|uniref:LicD/FKTN/FKRP nucleotidyltransferase domain-containing protein n=1 Tax=Meganyctiphanes norvegica TaxID=48144 RepID=A0AAV2R350_MEGNR